MKQILVYGDSLSWGIIPATRERLAFDARWPGVLEHALTEAGHSVRVIEDCLNGRRTIWDDPFKPGRNGSVGLAQRIEMHAPLALVILMLGTNDFQSVHDLRAWHSAQGISRLITEIRTAPIEPGMPVPPILVVAPPEFGEPRGAATLKFAGAGAKAVGLAEAYEDVAQQLECAFFDAGSVVSSSQLDGVHLDRGAHHELGQALARVVAALEI